MPYKMRSFGRKGHLEESLMLSAVIMARRFQPLSGFRLDHIVLNPAQTEETYPVSKISRERKILFV